MRPSDSADFLLRLAVAIAFIYPAVNALLDPYAWIGYFPVFMKDIIPDMTLLYLFGALQAGIGLWILSGRKIFVPSLTAAALLLAIVVFNLGDLQILFRDVSIALAALALAIAHRPQRA